MDGEPIPTEPDGGIGGPIEEFPIDWLPVEPFPFDPLPFGGPVPIPHTVTVPSGQIVTGFDFGNARIEPGSIQGTKWLDANGDGIRDDSEPGVAGITIYLDANMNGELDADERFVVTQDDDPSTDFDEAGSYRFDDLPSQQYTVREVLPADMEQTFPVWDFWLAFDRPAIIGNGGGHYVFVGNSESIEGLDFGNRPIPDPAVITGTKWLDVNGDGARTDDEPGLAGITIYADTNDNGWLDRGEPLTETDDSGRYELIVPPGEFTIREQLPPGFVQTFPVAQPEIIIDVDVAPLTPLSAIGFDLTDVELTDPTDEGRSVAMLTFEVTYPDGCGQVLPDMSYAESDGGEFIRAELYGQVFAGFCDQAISVQELVVEAEVNAFGPLLIEASFTESDDIDARPEVPSYLLSAWVHWDGVGDTGHDVSVASGDTLEGIDFGNQRVDDEGAPDPTFARRADVDQDGVLSANDIDTLAAAIRADQTETEAHDLSGDGLVDDADLDFLVHNLMRAKFGDSNMDGVFDSSDLVKVFTAGQYEDGVEGNSHWDTGDWNGDGEFNSSDLVKAFQDGYSI